MIARAGVPVVHKTNDGAGEGVNNVSILIWLRVFKIVPIGAGVPAAQKTGSEDGLRVLQKIHY